MTDEAGADLAGLPEDEQIRIIGECAQDGDVTGFIVQDAKMAERYIRKLTARYSVDVIDQVPGPGPYAITVQIGPRVH